jgi:hypothetical protein
MLKIIKLTGILSLFFIITHGQGLTNHWEMGYGSYWGHPFGGIDINFVNGFPDTSYVNRQMDFYATNGVISDSIGNLLFYTNGIYIANANNDTMLNGSGLNPGTFADDWFNGMPLPQGNIVLPVPGYLDQYYLFHETCTDAGSLTQPLELFYSLIDMNLDGGLGGVVIKNQVVLHDTLEWGELSATRHANGRDWWLLFHKINSDMFYKLLISPYGISVYSQNYGTFRNEYGGTSAFSPDGTKFSHYNVSTDIDIYDFDRCTGMLSNYINIPVNDSSVFGSVVFSPGSNLLYAISTYFIYQFDLTAGNIPASMQTVAVWDSFASPFPYATDFCIGELAANGRIYVNSTNGVLDMHAINFPDSLGLGCDVEQHSLHLPAYNAATIPNFPNYYLGRDVGSPCDSLTGVKEVSHGSIPIQINPNPAQNSFYLNYKLPCGNNADMRIYNTLGEEVMHKKLYWYFGYLQIDCSNLENGVYFVKIDAGKYGGSGKLIIAR